MEDIRYLVLVDPGVLRGLVLDGLASEPQFDFLLCVLDGIRSVADVTADILNLG